MEVAAVAEVEVAAAAEVEDMRLLRSRCMFSCPLNLLPLRHRW